MQVAKMQTKIDKISKKSSNFRDVANGLSEFVECRLIKHYGGGKGVTP